uniref:Uncharacterized protein n=1 Tax=Rhizophora mucronata TaxID=61149 RepID=A0A2P2LFX8_RHIMU
MSLPSFPIMDRISELKNWNEKEGFVELNPLKISYSMPIHTLVMKHVVSGVAYFFLLYHNVPQDVQIAA